MAKIDGRGFTLIEMLIVISIIAILSLILFFVGKNYVISTYKAAALANARVCLSSIQNSIAMGSTVEYPSNCETDHPNYTYCSCSVSGFAGRVKCKLIDGGSVHCEEN